MAEDYHRGETVNAGRSKATKGEQPQYFLPLIFYIVVHSTHTLNPSTVDSVPSYRLDPATSDETPPMTACDSGRTYKYKP